MNTSALGTRLSHRSTGALWVCCIPNCFPILFLWRVSLVHSHWKVLCVSVTCLAFLMGSIANSIHQNQYFCIPSSSVMLLIQSRGELVKLTNLQNKPKMTKMNFCNRLTFCQFPKLDWLSWGQTDWLCWTKGSRGRVRACQGGKIATAPLHIDLNLLQFLCAPLAK